MQNGEHHWYDFENIGETGNLYKFETKNGVEYDVRFKASSDYIPPDEPWRDEFYELIIAVASAPDPTHIPADRMVFPTVAAIITEFFRVHERIILYICDDADAKELARKRKFDGWYNQLGSELFQKYDLPTVGTNNHRYFASVFFRRDNPHRFAVVATFERLATSDK